MKRTLSLQEAIEIWLQSRGMTKTQATELTQEAQVSLTLQIGNPELLWDALLHDLNKRWHDDGAQALFMRLQDSGEREIFLQLMAGEGPEVDGEPVSEPPRTGFVIPLVMLARNDWAVLMGGKLVPVLESLVAQFVPRGRVKTWSMWFSDGTKLMLSMAKIALPTLYSEFVDNYKPAATDAVAMRIRCDDETMQVDPRWGYLQVDLEVDTKDYLSFFEALSLPR